MRRNDAAACHRIRNEAPRADCLLAVARHTQDSTVCAQIALPTLHDRCLKDLVLPKRDLSLCSKLHEPWRRDACHASAAYEFAAAEGCTRVKDEDARNECYFELVKQRGPAELCDKVTVRKTTCYAAAARRGDPSLCERVGPGPGSPARQRCYAAAFRKAAPFNATCDKIPDQAQKQECLSWLGRAAGGVLVCAQVTLPDAADDCWASKATSDAANCLNIQNADRKQWCIAEYWTSTSDPRVCGLLGPEQLQQRCLTTHARRAALQR